MRRFLLIAKISFYVIVLSLFIYFVDINASQTVDINFIVYKIEKVSFLLIATVSFLVGMLFYALASLFIKSKKSGNTQDK